ncbi:hypothetical protein [Chryseobacterium gambrini]|uniref:hypothetical protein n=1 Tax=Chryseobacterium gambrini TaxID=373672 RepID=UPI0022F3D470|nr:hypothetical protein [Chryseobacterium gambrini]WBX97885.1 hypothetical protein PE065_01220 [Chryseobacterium gambrini]
MKKHISILSLLVILLMQSCERSDDDFNIIEQKNLKIEVQNYNDSEKIGNKESGESDSDSLDTGDDDDDPPRDKQHWKIAQDTIGNRNLLN